MKGKAIAYTIITPIKYCNMNPKFVRYRFQSERKEK